MDRKFDENLNSILKYLENALIENTLEFVFPETIRENLDLWHQDYRVVFFAEFSSYITHLLKHDYLERSKYTDEVKITIAGLKFIQNGGFGPQPSKTQEIHKDKNWFKVGLLFATGEMDNLMKQFNMNATKVAQHLDSKSYRPYISESISNTNTTDKNIFSKPEKLKIIYRHCIENDIPMVDSFKDKVPSE